MMMFAKRVLQSTLKVPAANMHVRVMYICMHTADSGCALAFTELQLHQGR